MSSLHSTDAKQAISEFLLRLRLARASELALAGRLLKAEEVLSWGGNQPESEEELDLLARILVLQKRFIEADKLWQVALRVSGERQIYLAARNSLAGHLARLHRRKRLILIALGVANVILGSILALFLIWRLPFP